MPILLINWTHTFKTRSELVDACVSEINLLMSMLQCYNAGADTEGGSGWPGLMLDYLDNTNLSPSGQQMMDRGDTAV